MLAIASGALACQILTASPAAASLESLLRGTLDHTYVLGISQGNSLSSIPQAAMAESYDLSDGSPQTLRDWYHPDWIDMRINMMTQLDEHFGILWGVSTGEYAPKYEIEPALMVGVIYQQDVSPNAVLTFTAIGTFWGKLRESPCIADYDSIGPSQEVNCRLAAGVLPPEETLRYLWNEDPPARLAVNLRFAMTF